VVPRAFPLVPGKVFPRVTEKVSLLALGKVLLLVPVRRVFLVVPVEMFPVPHIHSLRGQQHQPAGIIL
jgi:hypothetical protein